MNAANPLSVKRIGWSPRSIEQSRDLKDRLENLGATILLFPAVRFSEPADTSKELDLVIRSLETFDWILFTSANAVRFSRGGCNKLGKKLSRTETASLCVAVGPATGSAAAAEGFMVNYIAQEFVGAALARELSASLAGKRVLLPRGER